MGMSKNCQYCDLIFWEGIIVPLLRLSLFYFGGAEVDEGPEVEERDLVYFCPLIYFSPLVYFDPLIYFGPL